MKKVVVKLNSMDDKIKQNPMQAVSSISGIVSMELNTKDSKITIIGDVDPVQVVKKLRKWFPQIDTVGPAKADGDKKPAAGGGDKKQDGDKNKAPTEQEQMARLLEAYRNYNPPAYDTQHYVHTYEENPNACVIC